MLLLTN